MDATYCGRRGAAIAHGSARLTSDVDIVYSRHAENIRNLVAALQNHQPYLRGAPPDLPFRWDEQTVKNGLNFTLTTSLDDLGLLGEVTGGGSYEELPLFRGDRRNLYRIPLP